MPDALLEVVAGALLRWDADAGEPCVLQACRPAHAHQGGKWEFPGGKVKPGECARAALQRELEEEIGVQKPLAEPLIRFPYAYPEFQMDFAVFRVESWSGEPHGCEGQELRWVPLSRLHELDTPPASKPVAKALRLPQKYAISRDPEEGEDAWLKDFAVTLDQDIDLIQFRAHALKGEAYERLASKAIAQAQAAGCRIVLNASPRQALQSGADGVHLTSARLRELDRRPLPENLLVGASCHDEEELRKAAEINADFAVLTVRREGSGPQGLEGFGQAIAKAALPVYALGGMTTKDLRFAVACGGQGIAAIRGLWGRGPTKE